MAETDPLRRPVFVLSTGRSGSTLLQRLLNCHAELVLWGEHFGFLGSAVAALTHMHNPAQRHYPRHAAENRGWQRVVPALRDPAAALEWVNPWSMDEYREQLRAFVEHYFAARLAPGQRWGFKEIRYNSMPMLNGLRGLYPEARFVFVKRDPVEVVRSKVYAFVKEARWQALRPQDRHARLRVLLKEVQGHFGIYDTFLAQHGAAATAVQFEALVGEPQRVLDGLLAHLGLDPQRFDRGLAGAVLGSVITTTRRDEELVALIREVQDELAR